MVGGTDIGKVPPVDMSSRGSEGTQRVRSVGGAQTSCPPWIKLRQRHPRLRVRRGRSCAGSTRSSSPWPPPWWSRSGPT